MKIVITLLFVLFSGSSYSSETYKSINFKEATIAIPAKWNFAEEEDCLFIWKGQFQSVSYLRVCRGMSSGESDYFTVNDNGVWEAITDGVPILADVFVTTKYTGMSAIVSCKYNDDAGYHTGKCFQAEIELPTHINFTFAGVGESSLFKDYKEAYLSFKIK
ncbi:hypothetical protein [Pseudocitrobacter faecalis]|uniref:hypothetical protein n=1 Tax=Pseudocitrobacter faecalis TaxID=1398493 RepID=UPI003B9F29E6